MIYDIEITEFAPDARTSRAVVNTAEEAWAAARAAEALDACMLLVTRHEETVNWGDFYIWLAGGRASVRLDEHRDWYATDPEAMPVGDAAAETELEFGDEFGPFFKPRSKTVSRAQAFEALEYYLRTREMLPSLTWT
ncbi:MAG TPA: hypothetical protein VGX50_06455 [Longimicrobium sp.]|nr:hypothetical protein [Longimicrobium sp.]